VTELNGWMDASTMSDVQNIGRVMRLHSDFTRDYFDVTVAMDYVTSSGFRDLLWPSVTWKL